MLADPNIFLAVLTLSTHNSEYYVKPHIHLSPGKRTSYELITSQDLLLILYMPDPRYGVHKAR